MVGESVLPSLTDMIAVRPVSSGSAGPRPGPGTFFTVTVETIDNDQESWFLGVLPPR